MEAWKYFKLNNNENTAYIHGMQLKTWLEENLYTQDEYVRKKKGTKAII